jgi:hypothetical protein
VVAPRVRVLFDDPALEEYARAVAGRAEAALEQLTRLFGSAPAPVTITLDGATDLYTAIAPPLPRPRVALPALFPVVPEVDLANPDPLYELLLHELTHVVQLAFLERPDGTVGFPRLGLVGEAVAPVPPGWLLEGLAVWVADELAGTFAGPGNARSRGILAALALEGEWPGLADVSLLSHQRWPGGEARYLLGGAFVGYLVDRYGWDTMLAALREANAGWHALPFSQAWLRATGDDLDALWRAWSEQVFARAAERVAREELEPGEPWLEHGRASTVLALDATGERLAWRPASGGLVVSSAEAGLEGLVRALPGHVRPLALAWTGPQTLVYSRLAPGPDDRFVDLFELDLASGSETRLTVGERARLPRGGPRGCVFYVRDVVGEGSELRRLCPAGEPERVYLAAAGRHIVGVAVSDEGRVALSVWRDGFVDLALLEQARPEDAEAPAAGPPLALGEPGHAGRLRWLTQDPAQELDPWWSGEEELVFRSDRGEVFELYSLRLGEQRLRRLTASIGGAFSPSLAGGTVAYARLGGQGWDVAAVPLEQTVELLELAPQPLPPAAAFEEGYPIRDYLAGDSLLPFGWLPEVSLESTTPLALSAAVRVLGQDGSGDHSYALTFGFDPTLAGPLAGGWLTARYDYRGVDAFDLFQRPPPLGFGVQAGAWPHLAHLATAAEPAVGGLVELNARSPLGDWSGLARLRAAGLLLEPYQSVQPDVRLDAVASRRFIDLWGYGVSGPRVSLHGAWSASASGPSAGLWLDASTVLPPGELPLTTLLAVRAGYRPLPPVPLTPESFALFGSVGARDSFPVRLRLADGIVALERLTVEGRVHALFDGSLAAAADLSLWGDTMIRYGAPVSLGGTVGYAGGLWYRLGLRLPF